MRLVPTTPECQRGALGVHGQLATLSGALGSFVLYEYARLELRGLDCSNFVQSCNYFLAPIPAVSSVAARLVLESSGAIIAGRLNELQGETWLQLLPIVEFCLVRTFTSEVLNRHQTIGWVAQIQNNEFTVVMICVVAFAIALCDSC
jgi:hypothetical protein